MSYLEELRAGKARNWKPESSQVPRFSDHEMQKIKGKKALRDVGVLEVLHLNRERLESGGFCKVHFMELPHPEDGSYEETMFFGERLVSVKVTNDGNFTIEGREDIHISNDELRDDPNLVIEALRIAMNDPKPNPQLHNDPVVTDPPSVG